MDASAMGVNYIMCRQDFHDLSSYCIKAYILPGLDVDLSTRWSYIGNERPKPVSKTIV